ncbi:MAG: cyclic pyranopterin monophosphate synthase MoaC [Actinobacteria bacterium]|nr:cyclic pyranopterin monophosphate synthase MoaC [Actinomycetota bacterium]
MALTHVDDKGNAHMVDVGGKDVTQRSATASAIVRTTAAAEIASDNVRKGDVCAVARIAGIMAAKRCPDLIPLAHPMSLTSVSVDVIPEPVSAQVRIEATVSTRDRTGVEMEALTAVSVAGLTVIDMIKAIDRRAAMTDVQVERKSGGASGDFRR